MQRVIYEVYAKVVDANGNYNTLSGYPKVFDSRNYNGDATITFNRAKGSFHTTFGTMCNVDGRPMQMVILMTADGRVIDRQVLGAVPDDPDPEPEPEPEPEEE